MSDRTATIHAVAEEATLWDPLPLPSASGARAGAAAIRQAVLTLLATGATNPVAIGAAAQAAMVMGDPYRHELPLFALDDDR
jgi:hypothetical protein